MNRQDIVEQWLREHEPTRCPTVAVASTTARVAVGPLPLPIMKKGSQRGKPKEDKPKVSKVEGQRQRRLARRGGRQYLPSVPMIGKTFGEIVVLRHSHTARKHKSTGSRTFWHCRCSCGVEKVVDGYELRRGRVKSCGHMASNKVIDRLGHKYGSWTALEQIPKPEHLRGSDTYWRIRCDCGVEKIVRSSYLRYVRFEDGPCKHLRAKSAPSSSPSATPAAPEAEPPSR